MSIPKYNYPSPTSAGREAKANEDNEESFLKPYHLLYPLIGGAIGGGIQMWRHNFTLNDVYEDFRDNYGPRIGAVFQRSPITPPISPPPFTEYLPVGNIPLPDTDMFNYLPREDLRWEVVNGRARIKYIGPNRGDM